MQSNELVGLKDIQLSYGPQTVLEGLTLNVRAGEIFGILGRIGSGKTRILRLIAGLEKPQHGKVELSPEASNNKIGYIVQNDLLIPWLTVEENLRLCSGRQVWDDPLLKDIDLQSMLAKKPGQLSGGMRKKVNFARAFMNNSKLVLMDEPFGALDPVQKRELQALMLKLLSTTQTGGVMVTHDIQEALLICHRVALLSAKSHRVVTTLDNPYRGRTDTVSLLEESGYRKLIQTAMDFYDRERA